jgi:hypothetical protein
MSDFRPATTPGGEVPQRRLPILARSGASASPWTFRVRSDRQPVLEPVMGSRFDLAGPGRAQPGINFVALLLPQRLDDFLLGPAADLVSPALAVRSEALAEDAAPAAPATPVVPAVDVGRALVTEDDAAMALGHLPGMGECTGGSRLWLPGLRLAFQKGHLAAKPGGRNWVRTSDPSLVRRVLYR